MGDFAGFFDPKILEIYRKTFFQIRAASGKLISFTVNDSNTCTELKGRKFAVITAFNPMNKTRSILENEEDNKRLEADLQGCSYLYYPTVGVLGEHSEASFTVENISQEEAVDLGRKFRQYAILYCDQNGPRFIRCDNL